MVKKHVAFAPRNKWGLAPFMPKASLSFREKPCLRSLSNGFVTIQPSPSEGTRKSSLSPFSPSMFERRELRSRREERMENGVKNMRELSYFPKSPLIAELEMLKILIHGLTFLCREIK